MRVKILSCLAALALAPAIGSSGAAASPLAQGAAAKAAAPTGIQLAQAVRDLNKGGGGGGGGRSGGGDGVYTGGRGGDGVYRGGGGGRTFNTPAGVQVRDLNRTPGAGLGDSRRAFRDRSDFRDRSAFRDRRDVRRFDGDRRFVDRRIDRRHSWRDDRRRHRRVFRNGIYVYPYSSYAYSDACHRHHRGVRVLRHCHVYDYARHRHGGWR